MMHKKKNQKRDGDKSKEAPRDRNKGIEKSWVRNCNGRTITGSSKETCKKKSSKDRAKSKSDNFKTRYGESMSIRAATATGFQGLS
ncbi:hypothetical protein REPUB_Repub07fG0226600 [Reevesia pubescens]